MSPSQCHWKSPLSCLLFQHASCSCWPIRPLFLASKFFFLGWLAAACKLLLVGYLCLLLLDPNDTSYYMLVYRSAGTSHQYLTASWLVAKHTRELVAGCPILASWRWLYTKSHRGAGFGCYLPIYPSVDRRGWRSGRESMVIMESSCFVRILFSLAGRGGEIYSLSNGWSKCQKFETMLRRLSPGDMTIEND